MLDKVGAEQLLVYRKDIGYKKLCYDRYLLTYCIPMDSILGPVAFCRSYFQI